MPQQKNKRFGTCVRGSVGIIFAFTLAILIGAIGTAIDFAVASAAKSRMRSAADAAVLAAVRAAVDHMQQNGNDRIYVSDAIARGQEIGNALFSADAATEPEPPSFTIQIAFDNGVFIATGDGTMVVPTTFAAVLGVTHFDLGLSVQATSHLPQFTSLHLVLDISQSMGLGSTQADMKSLYQKTGCVFGCHDRMGQSKSNEEIAHAAGLTLRIDSLRAAVLDLLTLAEESSVSDYFQFAIGTLDYDHKTLVPSSGNYSLLRSAANDIDLGQTNSGGPAGSYLNEVMKDLSKTLPDGGDGRTEASPLRYVVFVSDGVYDTNNQPWCTWGHCTGTIDPKVCEKLKDKGISVAVIYTTYLPIYENPFDADPNRLREEYRVLVQPFETTIAPRMQACASPDLFFEAADGPAIHQAFRQLFGKLGVPYLVR